MPGQSSEQGYFVRGLVGGALQPLGADVVRDGIVNNINHLSDAVAVNSLVRAVTTTTFQLTSPSVSEYQAIPSLGCLAFPLHILPDGTSSRVVVRLRAYASAAGTVSFIVALSGAGTQPYIVDLPDSNHWKHLSTSSTTPVELVTSLYLTPAQLSATAFVKSRPSIQADGSLGSVQSIEAQLNVYAKTSNVAVLPTLTIVEADEWIA